MKSWPDNVAPPLGWEVNPELSKLYGYTIITEQQERARAQRQKRSTMQLFEERKKDDTEKRRRRARVAGMVGGGALAAGLIWKAARDTGGANHYHGSIKQRNQRAVRQKKDWLDANRKNFSHYEGRTDTEKARAWAQQTGTSIPRSLRPGYENFKKERNRRYGEFLGRKVPGGHPGGEAFGMHGEKMDKASAGSYKNGQFEKSALSGDILSVIGKRTGLPGVLYGIPNNKHPRRKS
jgi:hypothetical protein